MGTRNPRQGRDRHGVAGRDDLDVLFREIRRRLDSCRVGRRDDHRELVAGEADRGARGKAMVHELLRIGRVGGEEDVSRGPLLDLRLERG